MSQYPNYPQTPYSQPTYGQKPKPKVSGLAIASLVFGVASLLFSCIAGLVGVITGFIAIIQIQSSKGRSSGLGLAISGILLSLFLSMVIPLFVIIPSLASGIAEGTHRAADALNEFEQESNLRQIGWAIHKYENEHGKFPEDHYLNGRPALSWRVMILPYLEGGQVIFDRFDLNQNWDSIQNLDAAKEVPEVFRTSVLGVAKDETTIQRPIGSKTLFSNKEKSNVTFASVRDGSSNTIMCVQVDASNACFWAMPADYNYQANDPTRGLRLDEDSSFKALFVDGSVKSIDATAGAPATNRLFTSSSGD